MRPPGAGYTAHLLPGPQVARTEEELGALGLPNLARSHMEALWREQARVGFAVDTVCSCLDSQ